MGSYRSGVRVIGGRWKGRRVPVADVPGLRPTPDRIRETLFNWLRLDIEGARCLDLFAGSGVLSFEALSRGASEATAIDVHRKSVRTMAETRQLLGAEGLTLICERADRVLVSRPASNYDVVFVDPPFGYSEYADTFQLLDRNDWLSPTALIYVESDRDEEFDRPTGWTLVKSGEAGKVKYQLMQRGDC